MKTGVFFGESGGRQAALILPQVLCTTGAAASSAHTDAVEVTVQDLCSHMSPLLWRVSAPAIG